jgi:hypothetical protein
LVVDSADVDVLVVELHGRTFRTDDAEGADVRPLVR